MLLKPSDYRFYIGIDSGKNTGFAIWDRQEKNLIRVETMFIHQAMFLVHSLTSWQEIDGVVDGKYFVRVEDARLRTWFPKDVGKDQLQGAGSIKRDATIWEDFLADYKIPYQMVAPKKNKTKMEESYFKQLTGWKKRTSQHARDAAMLVFAY